jgi:1-acyl-sn-glycerol-3-phosphate acyltransferase
MTADPREGPDPRERPGSAKLKSERLDDTISPLIAVLTFGGRAFGRAMSRVSLEGALEELPREGPLIIAANHASNLDAPVIGAWLIPRLGRRIHWLGKKELFAWPLIGWVAANGGVHPVDRGAADVDAFRLAQRILDEGHVLFVFPEGTRSRDGVLQVARDGLALLALRTNAPVVPLGIAGSHRVWPRGQRLPHPGGRVTIRVGAPFRPADELPQDTPRSTAKGLVTNLIMRRIAALLPPGQRGPYGDPGRAAEDPVR